MNKKISFVISLILVMSLSFPIACGDGGIIGPPQIDIEETAQNAIVAWNGTEEVLILSVDIQSSESTKVLRIIPLPSNPINVTEGSFDSFTKLQEIVNEKLQEIWNASRKSLGIDNEYGVGSLNTVEVTFQDTLGAHNITIVKILDVTNFTDWATDFAESAGLNITFSSNFQSTVEEYLDDNISYFVFDIIDTTEDEYSIDPIIYRFKTDFLYYPLKITAASDVGETYASVNVFCIAKNRIKDEVFANISFYPNVGYYWYYSDYFSNINLTEDELLEISPDIYNLFKGDPILMSYRYNGYYSYLEDDMIVFDDDFAYPTFDIITEDDILIERGTKSIVNLTVRNTGNTELYIWFSIGGGIDWLQHDWYSISPYSWDTIVEGDETTFEILFDIPSNIPLGDYSLTYTVMSSSYDLEKQKNVTLTIYDKTEGGPGLYQDVEDLKTGMNNLVLGMIICIFLMAVLVVIVMSIVVKKPPGCIMVFTPAFAATSTASLNGKNASLAIIESLMFSFPLCVAIHVASTRDVCPPPIATVRVPFTKTTELDFTCLTHLTANSMDSRSF